MVLFLYDILRVDHADVAIDNEVILDVALTVVIYFKPIIDDDVAADSAVLVVGRVISYAHVHIVEIVVQNADVLTGSASANEEWTAVVGNIAFHEKIVYIRSG